MNESLNRIKNALTGKKREENKASLEEELLGMLAEVYEVLCDTEIAMQSRLDEIHLIFKDYGIIFPEKIEKQYKNEMLKFYTGEKICRKRNKADKTIDFLRFLRWTQEYETNNE